jgi:hypothetical protein
VFPTYSKWSPKDGLVIRLWKSDDQGHHKLPSGIPKHVFFRLIWGINVSKSVEKERFINSGISKYLEFWKLNILKNEMYV